MSYQLKVTIINSLGTFKGDLEVPAEATFEQLSAVVKTLQKNINGLDQITIIQNDGTELSFREEILKGSIVGFYIQEL